MRRAAFHTPEELHEIMNIRPVKVNIFERKTIRFQRNVPTVPSVPDLSNGPCEPIPCVPPEQTSLCEHENKL